MKLETDIHGRIREHSGIGYTFIRLIMSQKID